MEQDTKALVDPGVAQDSQAPRADIAAPSGAKIGRDRLWCNIQRAFRKYAVPWAITAFLCFAGVIVFPVAITEEYCARYYRPFDYYCSNHDDATWCREKECWQWKTRPRKMAYVLMGVSVLIVLVIRLGSINRIQLCKKFGLPGLGDAGTDLLRQLFCGPCSLYQKTRTLWQNRVVNGVRQGPHQMTTAPIQQPPILPTSHPFKQQYSPPTPPSDQHQPPGTGVPVMDLAPQQNRIPTKASAQAPLQYITQDGQDFKPYEDDSNAAV